MGILDRDYMKRRPAEDDAEGASPEARLDAFFQGLLRKHPRLPLASVIALVVFIVVMAVIARFSTGRP
jgi:hypothetical protein